VFFCDALLKSLQLSIFARGEMAERLIAAVLHTVSCGKTAVGDEPTWG